MNIQTFLVLVWCLSLIVFLICISFAAAKGPPPHEASWENAAAAQFQVVSPRGESTAEMITVAPGLDNLEGKTICLIAGDAFKADVTFPKLEELLNAEYPTATILPYTDFPYYEPGHYSRPSVYRKEVSDAIQEKGCDAVISGNGG